MFLLFPSVWLVYFFIVYCWRSFSPMALLSRLFYFMSETKNKNKPAKKNENQGWRVGGREIPSHYSAVAFTGDRDWTWDLRSSLVHHYCIVSPVQPRNRMQVCSNFLLDPSINPCFLSGGLYSNNAHCNDGGLDLTQCNNDHIFSSCAVSFLWSAPCLLL